MSVHTSVRPYVRPYIRPSVHASVHMSVRTYVRASVRASVRISVGPLDCGISMNQGSPAIQRRGKFWPRKDPKLIVNWLPTLPREWHQSCFVQMQLENTSILCLQGKILAKQTLSRRSPRDVDGGEISPRKMERKQLAKSILAFPWNCIHVQMFRFFLVSFRNFE